MGWGERDGREGERGGKEGEREKLMEQGAGMCGRDGHKSHKSHRQNEGLFFYEERNNHG